MTIGSNALHSKPSQLAILFNKILVVVAPASEYRTTNDEEEKKCGYSACLCDMEMVRCTVYYKNDFNTDKIGWSTTKCAITGTLFFTKLPIR